MLTSRASQRILIKPPRNPAALKGNEDLSDLKRTQLSVEKERAILVGVILPDSNADPRDPLGELSSLAQTAGGACRRPGHPTPAAARRGDVHRHGEDQGNRRPGRAARGQRSHFRQRPVAGADRGAGTHHQQGSREPLQLRHQGIRPFGADPRHLRHPRPDRRSQAAGGTGPDGIHLPAAGPDVEPPGAHSKRRGGRPGDTRAGRDAARNRPPARAQAGQRAEERH